MHVQFTADPENDRPEHQAHHHDSKGHTIAMKQIVDKLYERVLNDEKLKPFYKDTDISHLLEMESQLMTYVFGGRELMLLDKPEFNLRHIHMSALVNGPLTHEHWQAFVGHFQDTLDALPELPLEARESAMKWIRSTKDDFRPPSEEEVKAFHASAKQGSGKCPFMSPA